MLLELLVPKATIAYKAPPQVYIERVVEVPLETPPEAVLATTESIYCSCILTARHLGANLPKGDAKDLKRNATPTQGGVVLLKYGKVYHTAYIQFILKGGVWVNEGNYKRCQYTERFIPFDSDKIVGFWYNTPQPVVDTGN